MNYSFEKRKAEKDVCSTNIEQYPLLYHFYRNIKTMRLNSDIKENYILWSKINFLEKQLSSSSMSKYSLF